jgi:hypothetical protein
MKEAAAAYPDGEALMYGYLEGLIKNGPQSVIEGHRMNAETKNTVLHGKAPDRPPMARYEHTRREGIEALQYLTGNGLPIKDFFKSGADADATTYSTKTPIEPGKWYKVFIRGRFLCLDIDRNHKDGEDGIANLYRQLERIGKPRALLPDYMRDIERGSFPFFTQTPNGGLHLFFKYTGNYITDSFTTAVECKNLQISAGWKDGTPYVLHGDIEAAPPLPLFIRAAIQPPQKKPPEYRPYRQEKKEWGRPSWNKIIEWTDKDGRGSGGRNEYAYSLALHAASHDWPENETLDALRGEPYLDGLPEKELKTAVQSAYKRRRSA